MARETQLEVDGVVAEVTETRDRDAECWCCGQRIQDDSRAVRLGNHPEVVLCLRCAHFLHRRARALEDALRPSPLSRARDVLRSARDLVMRRGWHQRPVIGRVLRLLGRWTP